MTSLRTPFTMVISPLWTKPQEVFSTRHFSRRMFILWLLVCTFFLGGCGTKPAASAESDLQLAVLNVGKADCMLLFVQDKTYLIDTGWERTYGLLTEAFRQYGIEKLDGVFLTHCHKDHEGGLMRLARTDLPVDAWYAASIYYDVKDGQHPMLLAAQERGQSVTWLNAGDTITISPTAAIQVLGPLSVNTENENNNSLVLYVTADDGSILLAADMKTEEENELLEAGVVQAATVLKVGHHGDSGASGDWLVRNVMPRLAVISTSTKEEPDTPARSVIKRLELYGAECIVTQDFTHGIHITVRNGQASYDNIDWKLKSHSGEMRMSIDVANDLLTIRNSTSQPIALDGWTLYSSRGDTTITLTEKDVVPANGVYKIGTHSTGSGASTVLSINRLWHKSKYDQAILYDASGLVAAVTDNGMPE